MIKEKKKLHVRVPNILVQISMARYLFAEKWKGGRFVPFFYKLRIRGEKRGTKKPVSIPTPLSPILL